MRQILRRILKGLYVLYFIALNMLKVFVKPKEGRDFFNHVWKYASLSVCPIELKEASAIFPGIHEIQVSFPDISPQDVKVTFLELYYLCAIAKYIEAQNIFEIGTFTGATTLHMATNTDTNVRIFTLDLPPSLMDSTMFPISKSDLEFTENRQSGEKFKGSDVEYKITQFLDDSAAFDYSPFYGKMDLIFIDGSTQYEYVKMDSENAFKMLSKKKGSTIIWHDYGNGLGFEGVANALHELAKTKPLYRIRKTAFAAFIR